jgi:SMI1-KNR4 cell-wall
MRDEQLLLLVESPPPPVPVDTGTPDGWGVVERRLCSSLPDDYKWLINTYGYGDFCDLLVILNPFAATERMNLLSHVSPILVHYRQGGLRNHTFPCFPDDGGILPIANNSSGGDLFWLTGGQPDDWQLVFFDYDDYEKYPMGLVRFLAEWTSGRMPRSFFGTGNSPRVIRRDPVFCPAGKVRPPRPPRPPVASGGPSVSPASGTAPFPCSLKVETMETSEAAIAWFNAQGYFAWAMDAYAIGALFVATSARTDGTDVNWLQGGLVAVFPQDGKWTVAPLPDMKMGPLFEPMSVNSLDEAAAQAKSLIHGNTSDPAEKARIRAEARVGRKIWDPELWS